MQVDGNQTTQHDCDCQANQYTWSMTPMSTTLGNPVIPIAQPHLSTDGKVIYRKYVNALQNATLTPPYCRYLQAKVRWTNHNTNTVHWSALHAFLKSFHQNNQCCLVCFINDKLPLQASKSPPHNGLLLCPPCQCKPKTAWHFSECMHNKCATIFMTLKHNLTQLTQSLQLHPYVFTAFWLGLVAICTDTPYPEVLNKIPQPLWPLIQSQTWLGWDQLYQGKFLIAWANAINAMHPNLAKTGKQITTILITTI